MLMGGELGQGGDLELRGDAQGVLQNVIKGNAKSTAINPRSAEMQLVVGPLNHDITAVHWWSADNAVCGALSRPEAVLPLPVEVQKVQEGQCRRRPWYSLKPDIRNKLGYA